MRTSKWAFLGVCFVVAAVFIISNFISNHKTQETPSPLSPFVQQPVTSGTAPPSRAPRYISVRMKKPLKTLIAGETDSFVLEARLEGPEGSSENHPLWDRNAAAPLVIWIASPDESGIVFIDKLHPDRPRHHILMKFTLPSVSDATTLTTQVDYRVNSRTRAGSHSFWMDDYGEVVAANGDKIQDMGIIK
ncbi:MAG: hypothetical protein WAK95_11570, partial [Desulfobacterales bacterium]